ncbi:hypothetical protein RQM59_10815 [Flavobacteriaceae bacterium S356]|uniref:Uncharacterized protein n=1 Tax=Asprobacillus argus TaxID=3076534 RepID=A0ABU3LHE4_9FLAO|nr:hypothetical protein [Flavobacteriaceae bacterium S356]
MEDNTDKKLDRFAKKQIKNLELETPSKGFTKSIMDSISALETKNTFVYKPLIPKKVWILSVAAILAIVLIPFQKQEGGLLEKVSLDFSFLDKVSLPSLNLFEGMNVSSTTFYGFLLFAVMISIQVFYIKGYFSKRASGL